MEMIGFILPQELVYVRESAGEKRKKTDEKKNLKHIRD
jgi:hypothetical protein